MKWERFEGDTDTFAVRIGYLTDPSPRAVDSEEAVSWGSLQIWVEGQNLCAHTDQGETLQSAHWYLLDFLEWIALNWNALLHEERLPNRNAADSAVDSLQRTRNAPELAGEATTFAWEQEWYDWYQRHALRSARAGGLLPNVVFRRLRDAVEISWDDEPLPGSSPGFRFSAVNGVSVLSPDVVAGPLRDVTLAAARHLLKLKPESERLKRLVLGLAELNSPAHREQRLMWLAGARANSFAQENLLDGTLLTLFDGWSPVQPQDIWQKVLGALRSSDNHRAEAAALRVDESPIVITGSSQAALLFGAVAPSISEADIQILARVLVDQYVPSDVENLMLRELVAFRPLDPDQPAWEQGYDLAERLHDQLGLEGDWVDVASLADSLGITRLRRELSDAAVRGCGVVGPQHRPTVIINQNYPHSVNDTVERFTLAHEMCHILYDRAFGRRLAIASGPWAPRAIERRANAFAAMFLMPARLVARAVADLPDPITQPADIQTVSDRLHVSQSAAARHLYNLTLMSETDRACALRALGPGL